MQIVLKALLSKVVVEHAATLIHIHCVVGNIHRAGSDLYKCRISMGEGEGGRRAIHRTITHPRTSVSSNYQLKKKNTKNPSLVRLNTKY